MTSVSGNPMQEIMSGRTVGSDAATMTQARFDALVDAVALAEAKWTADAQASYEEHDDFPAYQEALQRVSVLDSALDVLVSRFPLQAKARLGIKS